MLRQEREQGYLAALMDEHQPVGPTESLLVRELARRAAALDRWDDAAAAAARQTARLAPMLCLSTGSETGGGDDTPLSLALSAGPAQITERLSLTESRAFHRALQRLQDIQTRRRSASHPAQRMPPPFTSEVDCLAYLVEQYLQSSYAS